MLRGNCSRKARSFVCSYGRPAAWTTLLTWRPNVWSAIYKTLTRYAKEWRVASSFFTSLPIIACGRAMVRNSMNLM